MERLTHDQMDLLRLAVLNGSLGPVVAEMLREAKAEAWDEGHAAAHGYDLSHHLDRDEWGEMPKDPANPHQD